MILDQKVKVFLKVARAEGFRRAARRLNISQSAVSFHIDRLEDELGVRLFNRQGRTISLTPPGEALLQELEQLERVALKAENNFAIHSSALGRRIRVGSNAIACPFTLPWVIHGFKQEHPEVIFTYRHIVDEQELIGDLESGDLDLGIIGHHIRHKKFDSHPCYESDVILVGAESIEIDHLTVEQLPSLPIIFESSDRGLELLLTQGLNEVGLKLKDLDIMIESDNLSLIKTFVQAGLGAAFLPRVTMSDELECGSFQEIRVDSLSLRQTIYLISPRSAALSPNTARFVDFVGRQLNVLVPNLS